MVDRKEDNRVPSDLIRRFDIVCSHCNNDSSMRYDYQQGIVVCESCGLISESRFIDQTAEYRIFSEGGNGSDPRRAGGVYNENLTSGDLGTRIDNKTNKKTTYAEKTISTEDKKHSQGMRKIRDWSHTLNLEQKIQNAASEKFEKLLSNKKFQGKNLDKVISTLLFWASKSENSPISLEQLENVTGQNKAEIRKTLLKMKKEDPTMLSLTKPSVFVSNFGGSLALPLNVVEKAKRFAEKLEYRGTFEGRNPRNIASVALYIISNCEGSKINLVDIAKVSNIAENTIRTTCKNLIPELNGLDLAPEEKGKIETLLSSRCI